MKKLMQALMSSVLALTMVFALPVASEAATGTFSVKVSGTNVMFIRGGKTTATYPMTSKDITLMTDTEDDFLVSFLGKSSKRTYVSLGSQTTLSISGDINALTLDEKLDDGISVAVPSGTTIATMKVNNGSRVNIRGKIGTLTVSDAGDVTVASGGSITTAKLTSSKAYLTASTGSSVKTVETVSKSSVSGSGIGSVKTTGKNSSSGGGSGSSTDYNRDGIRLVIDPIDADDGDELDDLIYELNDCVVAEDKDGDAIRGEVEWVSKGSTEVRDGGSYSFRFVPDSSRYDEITGKVKVYTDGGYDDDDNYDDADYELEIDSIDVASGNKRLRDLSKSLNDSVKAYDYDGKRINGRATWVDPTSTRVVRSDEYEFTFKPSSNKYDPVTDVIDINVDDDESFDETGLKVIADDIRISRSKKLGDLVNQLNDAITAYDIDGETVTGSADWYDNSSTLVKSTGTYEFVFNPRGSYRSVRGECTIYVGSSGGGSSNSGSTDISLEIGEIEIDDVTRLSELVDELNDEVVAYDGSGKKIAGKCTWVSGNASTKVRGTNEFQFEFKPSSSRYGKVKDYITIYLE